MGRDHESIGGEEWNKKGEKKRGKKHWIEIIYMVAVKYR
jgi:hypothetical protein